MKNVVVTNCHVIDKSATLLVNWQSREYPATLKHSDYDRDVCSLAVAGMVAPPATLGATQSLKVGQKVFAIGAPQGLELTLSEGIISSLREVTDGRYLQISAPISPGSSGGGLFDEDGSLIGLPTFYLGGGQQLNFAVPVEWIKALPQRSTRTKPTEQPTTLWLSKAIELEGKNDWFELLKQSQAWIRAKPQEPLAWFALGIAYDQLAIFDKAIKAYQQALRINPEPARGWNNLGVVYERVGQITKAIEAYQQALLINPELANAWFNLGGAYGKVGQTSKAIEAYQQAVSINPEYIEAWFNLGIEYRISKQTSKVMVVYKLLKRLEPAKADKFFNEIVLP